MKLLALCIALASSAAIACPDGASKDAMAPAVSPSSQTVAKVTPKSLATTSAAPVKPTAKTSDKQATSTTALRKTAAL